MLSRGNSPRMRAIQGMSVARWMGIATACASVSPCSVNRLADASRPSFTMGENELLRSVSSISLAMPSSLLRTTSTVTGSSVVCVIAFISQSVQHEIAECVKAGTPAGQKQRRGIGLLDNGRPVEHGTRFETGAVINGGIDCALMLGKENARAARTCRATAWRPLFLRLVRGGNAVHRAQSDETQRCLAGKAEGALVRG